MSCTSTSQTTLTTLTIQVETSTPTMTPRPTRTPRPTGTHTPIPTATFTPWPTKEVLAQFGVFGGDGGREYYSFIGHGMPKWVLYTDGQLIVQKEDNMGVWFEETKLTAAQMCSLLSQIEQVGFFTLAYDNSSVAGIPTANPIYKFDSSTWFTEGGSWYVLQVNGPNPREIDVYLSYEPYLVPEARRVFDFFNNYSPPSRLTEYQPQYLLLRIQEGLGDAVNATPVPATYIWPADLPPLSILTTQNVDTTVSYLGKRPFSQVLLQGEQTKPFFDVFGNRLAYRLFQSEDQLYYVVARPFLPHETLNDFSMVPEEKQYALPFSCSN